MSHQHNRRNNRIFRRLPLGQILSRLTRMIAQRLLSTIVYGVVAILAVGFMWWLIFFFGILLMPLVKWMMLEVTTVDRAENYALPFAWMIAFFLIFPTILLYWFQTHYNDWRKVSDHADVHPERNSTRLKTMPSSQAIDDMIANDGEIPDYAFDRNDDNR